MEGSVAWIDHMVVHFRGETFGDGLDQLARGDLIDRKYGPHQSKAFSPPTRL